MTRVKKVLCLLGLLAVAVLAERFHSFPPGLMRPAREGVTPNIRMSEVTGPEGHRTIRVDAADGQNESILPFSTLAAWDFSAAQPASPPSVVADLHGREISLIGFMFPLEEGEAVKAFCLIATTQTCCYGPKPQFNQFVLVETPVPIAFERMRPVRAKGTFFVEPQPQDGYIFRMAAVSVLPMGNQMFAAAATTAIDLPRFDWFWMDSLRPPFQPKSVHELVLSMHIPPPIASMADKEIQVDGYIAGQIRLPISGDCLLVARDFWDGCCVGVPPSPFNAFPARLASDSPQPEPWLQRARFSGRLRVRERKDWGVEGIIFLADARLIGPTEAQPGKSQSRE